MKLSNFFSAYRIVHRLPGRIRIQIPALSRLPDGWQKFLKPATELIMLKKGIQTVEIQPVTGSLRIDYDPEKLDETGILLWLKSLVTDFLKVEAPSKPLSDENIRIRIERLRGRLSP